MGWSEYMRFLAILMQAACFVALGLLVEYFEFGIVIVEFCFYMLGIIATIANIEIHKPRK
jgi:hypothetical protein